MDNSDDTDRYRASINTDVKVITSNVQLSPIETAEAVKNNGIVVFPAALDPATISQLNAEFDRMLNPSHRESLGFAIDQFDNIVNVRVIRERLVSVAFPVVDALFSFPWMDEVAAAYFGKDAYKLNDEIFVSDLSETKTEQPNPPFALHFDKRQVLKFFVYLTDTDESNGAMRASPGSHHINRGRRIEAMRSGNLQDIPNVLPEPDVPSVPIIGPAGTMFVFDTDMGHGASRVEVGKTRRTMRGHTHSLAMLQAMAKDAALAARTDDTI